MSAQIKRSDFPDYASYIDAIAEPVSGANSPAVWDEDEGVFVLNPAWIAEQVRRGRRIPPQSPPPTWTG